MKPLTQRYLDYAHKRTTEIDVALCAAGLPPMGINWLHPSAKAYREGIHTFENYADAFAGVLDEKAKAGVKHCLEQARKAKLKRGAVGEAGETIRDIICKLAVSDEHREETAPELWPAFFGELDALHLDPKEIGDTYSYNYREHRKDISLGHFQNVVSKVREKSG